jgi:hypothetical protein
MAAVGYPVPSQAERSFPAPDSEDPPFPVCMSCGQKHTRREKNGKWVMTCAAHANVAWKPEEHGRPCRSSPVRGLAVCRVHGGGTQAARAAAKRRVALESTMDELVHVGGEIDVSPEEAILAMVRKCAWNVALYERCVQLLRISPDLLDDAVATEEGWDGDAAVAEVAADWQLRSIVSRISPADWRAGPHALVVMYDTERDRLVKYSKLAMDAGVDERLTRVAEQAGSYLVTALDLLLPALGLTAEQQARLPALMPRVIDALESGEPVLSLESDRAHADSR